VKAVTARIKRRPSLAQNIGHDVSHGDSISHEKLHVKREKIIKNILPTLTLARDSLLFRHTPRRHVTPVSVGAHPCGRPSYVSRRTLWLYANLQIPCRGRPMWRPTGRCLPPHAIRYGYKLTYKSTVGTGVPDCPSYASRRVVWIRHHLKRRRFLRSYLAHLPWLNLYFCCYATKIKEKYNVWLADIHGSKSVRITPRLLKYCIYYCRGYPMW